VVEDQQQIAPPYLPALLPLNVQLLRIGLPLPEQKRAPPYHFALLPLNAQLVMPELVETQPTAPPDPALLPLNTQPLKIGLLLLPQ